MPNPVITVTNSTSIVLIDTQQSIGYGYSLVLMSNVDYAGSIVTVRDLTGYASPSNAILISTTAGLRFQDDSFSTLITQPFGLFTFNSFYPGIWTIINNYAFPMQNQAAFVKNITCDTISIGFQQTAQIASVEVSTARIYASQFISSSTYANFTDTNVTGNLTAAQTITTPGFISAATVIAREDLITSSLTTSNIALLRGSTIQLGAFDVNSNARFRQPVALQQGIQIAGPTILSNTLNVREDVTMQANLNVSAITTNVTAANNFFVNGFTRLRQAATLDSDLTVSGAATFSSPAFFQDAILVSSSISTLGALSVQQGAYFSSVVTFNAPIQIPPFQNLTVFSSIQTFSSMTVSTNLTVRGSEFLLGNLTLGSNLTAGGIATFSNQIISVSSITTQSNLTVGATAQFNSNVIISNTVSVGADTLLSGSLSTLGQAVFTAPLFTQAFTTLSTTSTLGNQTTTGFTSMRSFSTVGSAAITGDLTVNGTLFAQLAPAGPTVSFNKPVILTDLGAVGLPQGINGYYLQNSLSTLYVGYSTLAQPALTVRSNAVGIMNSTPTRTLDVQGDFRVVNAAANQTLTYINDSASSNSLRLNGVSQSFFETGIAGTWVSRLLASNANTSIFQVNGGTSITIQGNSVGVGTSANPSFTLTTNTLNTTGNTVINGTTTLVGSLSFGAATASGTLNMNGQSITGAANITTTTLNATNISGFSIQGNLNMNNQAITNAASITANGDITAFSDKRLKTNVMTIPSALSTVESMRGVFYTPIASPTQQKVGVIAQEIEEVLPQVVLQPDPSSETPYKSVNYGAITGVLIEAIKELSARVQLLEKQAAAH